MRRPVSDVGVSLGIPHKSTGLLALEAGTDLMTRITHSSNLAQGYSVGPQTVDF